MSSLTTKRNWTQFFTIRWSLVLAVGVIVLGLLLSQLMLSPAAATVVSGVIILIYLIVIARAPLVGLLLWLITQPLADRYINLSLGAGIPDLSPTRVCIVFLVVLILARASVGYIKLVPFTRTDGVAVLLLIGMSLSAPGGRGGWSSLQDIFDMYFVPVLVYFLMKNLVRDKAQLKIVLHVLVFLGTYLALYAIYEQSTGNVLFAVSDGSAVYGDSGLRIIRGLLGHPHEFGRIFGMVIPLDFYLLLEGKRPSRRFIYAITLGLMIAGLYLTYRRTAWIAAIVSFFLIQLFYPRFRKLFFILLIVTASGIYLNRDQLGDSAVAVRVQSGNTSTLNGRTEGWDYAVELWQRRPITGQGYNQFSRIATREGRRDTAIESQYLSVLVSAGLLGFVPYVLLLAMLPLRFVKHIRGSPDPDDRWLIVVFWGAFASYLVNAYTATVGNIIVTSVLFALAGSLFFLTQKQPSSLHT